jgi:hypothetical protein
LNHAATFGLLVAVLFIAGRAAAKSFDSCYSFDGNLADEGGGGYDGTTIGAVVRLHVRGDVMNVNGDITCQSAADKNEFPDCRTYESGVGSRWTSSMLRARGYPGTGLVVHADDVGPREVVTGLPLIRRRVAVRICQS